MLAFYIIFHQLFSPLLGGFWCNFRFYFFIRYVCMNTDNVGRVLMKLMVFFDRVLESHWFVWATQVSHLPMHIDLDKKKDWVSMQVLFHCSCDPLFLLAKKLE